MELCRSTESKRHPWCSNAASSKAITLSKAHKLLYTASKSPRHRQVFGLLVGQERWKFMKQNDGNTGEKGANQAPAQGKKPYQKPEFRFEKVFETMALACGKIEPTLPSCGRFNRKAS